MTNHPNRSKTLSGLLTRATCQHCIDAALAAPQNEHGWSDLGSVYECGNAAGVVGHIYVFTRTGKTALCIVPERAA